MERVTREEALASMCLFDDVFMREVLRDDAASTEVVLRAVTGVEDLVVDSFETQRDEKFVGIRSAELDVLARDGEGRLYDIEIQQGDVLDGRRMRYYGSLMDVDALRPGKDFSELPERWVVFLAEGDPCGKAWPLYHWCYREQSSHEQLGDDTHMLAVNGTWRGDDPVGRLMHDFACTDPREMVVPELRERVQYLKEMHKGSGGETMSNPVWERYVAQEREDAREQGLEQGREEALCQNARSLMDKLHLEAPAVLDLLSVPEGRRANILAML